MTYINDTNPHGPAAVEAELRADRVAEECYVEILGNLRASPRAALVELWEQDEDHAFAADVAHAVARHYGSYTVLPIDPTELGKEVLRVFDRHFNEWLAFTTARRLEASAGEAGDE